MPKDLKDLVPRLAQQRYSAGLCLVFRMMILSEDRIFSAHKMGTIPLFRMSTNFWGKYMLPLVRFVLYIRPSSSKDVSGEKGAPIYGIKNILQKGMKIEKQERDNL